MWTCTFSSFGLVFGEIYSRLSTQNWMRGRETMKCSAVIEPHILNCIGVWRRDTVRWASSSLFKPPIDDHSDAFSRSINGVLNIFVYSIYDWTFFLSIFIFQSVCLWTILTAHTQKTHSFCSGIWSSVFAFLKLYCFCFRHFAFDSFATPNICSQ